MTSRSHLVVEHLENVSGKVFDAYPEIIREMIKGKSGVYALYRRGSLYYVGLASNLSGRLKNHRRDRHSGLWDRFSVYLMAHVAPAVGPRCGGSAEKEHDEADEIRWYVRRSASAEFWNRTPWHRNAACPTCSEAP